MKHIAYPSSGSLSRVRTPQHAHLLIFALLLALLAACGGGEQLGTQVEVTGHISRSYTPSNPQAGIGDVDGDQPLRMFVSLLDGEQRAAIISFFVGTQPGTYPINGQEAIATYTDEGVIYLGVSGSLTLTAVTENLSGTFEFSGKRLDSEDSITVKGRFSGIPLSG